MVIGDAVLSFSHEACAYSFVHCGGFVLWHGFYDMLGVLSFGMVGLKIGMNDER